MRVPLRLMALLTVISLQSCAGLMGRSDNETINALQSELSILKKRVTMVERTNGVVESENRAHKQEIKRIKGDYDALQRQSGLKIKELGDANARLKDELAATAARLADESKKSADLAGRLAQTIQDYDKKISALSAGLAKAETNNKALSDTIAAREQALRDARAEIQKLKSDIADKNGAVAALEKTLRDRDAGAEKLKADNAAEIGRLKEAVDTLKAALAQKELELDALKKRPDQPEIKK